MNPTTITPTSVDSLIKASGLPIARGQAIVDAFRPLWEQAQEQIKASTAINVTDPTQVTEMKQARTARLALKKIRTTAENARVAFKASILAEGRAIDDVYRNIERLILPEETRLEEAEKLPERLEAERKRSLQAQRLEQLKPYGPMSIIGIDLGAMTEEAFGAFLDSAKAIHERRQAQAREEQAKRDADAEENRRKQEEMRAETERLRKANEDERAKAAEAQRIADEERRQREAIEKEQRGRDAAEKKRKDDEDRARRAAEAAPDAEKIRVVAKQLRDLMIPDTVTAAGDEATALIRDEILKLAHWVDGVADQIGCAA